MSGTILENLSGRKLSVLVGAFLLMLIGGFSIGHLVQAPPPAGTQQFSGMVCVDRDPNNPKVNRWFDPEECEKTDLSNMPKSDGLKADNLVFAMRMPHPRKDFSRWQQNLVGILQVTVQSIGDSKIMPIVELTLNVSLAYSNLYDPVWRMYASSVERRTMDCTSPTDSNEGYPPSCSILPMFELGSLHHDFYLLNIRLPVDGNKNQFGGRIEGMDLFAIYMNGGFTKVWVALKTFFFPFISGILAWFWHRVHIQERTPALLEYMLLSLGATLLVLDLPLEYLSLYFEMPYLLLLMDIIQGIFYAMLLSFWLVFAGEHMLIQDRGVKSTLRMYWKHLSAIVVGCSSLLIFDLCERGVQLQNPFYSIWVTAVGTNLALSFIILAGISATLYFAFLCYMVWRVFRNISAKRSVLPSMSSARRLHYEGIIYRFNFLMLATLVCAAITIISFILSQANDGQNKWDDQLDKDVSGTSMDASAMYTGVFGMWNVYICAMVILYAPSHKRWPADPIRSEHGEEVEFNHLPTDCSANEISSLTSFAAKASLD